MRRPLLAAMLCLLMLPAAARAATVTYRVPTVDGALVSVEVTRDPAVQAPVILTYSPYNVLGEGQETQEAGHRVALVLESSNSAWAIPDTPGLAVEVASGSSRLVLPVAPR